MVLEATSDVDVVPASDPFHTLPFLGVDGGQAAGVDRAVRLGVAAHLNFGRVTGRHVLRVVELFPAEGGFDGGGAVLRGRSSLVWDLKNKTHSSVLRQNSRCDRLGNHD